MCTPYPEKRLIRVRTNENLLYNNNTQESNSNDDPKRAHAHSMHSLLVFTF